MEDKLIIERIDYDNTMNCVFYSGFGASNGVKIKSIVFKNVNLDLHKKIEKIIGIEEYKPGPYFSVGLGKPDHFELYGVIPIKNYDIEYIKHDRLNDKKEVTEYKACECVVDRYVAVTTNRIIG